MGLLVWLCALAFPCRQLSALQAKGWTSCSLPISDWTVKPIDKRSAQRFGLGECSMNRHRPHDQPHDLAALCANPRWALPCSCSHLKLSLTPKKFWHLSERRSWHDREIYHWPALLPHLATFLPISLLLALLLTVTELSYRNEMTAIWSIGLSPLRMIGMLAPLALVIGIFHFADRGSAGSGGSANPARLGHC